MSNRRRDVWSASLLTTSALASAVLAFAAQAALARMMTPSDFGRFSSALAMIVLVAPAVGFGLPSFWLKAFGAEGGGAARWMPASIHFACCSAVLCVLLTIAWAFFQNEGIRINAATMLPVVLAQSAIEMAAARFQLEEHFGLVAIWQILQNGARLLLLGVCGFFHTGSESIAAGFGVISAVITIGALCSVRPLWTGTARLVGHRVQSATNTHSRLEARPTIVDVGRKAMPFGIASWLFFAYGQCGTLLLTHFGTARDVAAYSVATTILSGFYLGPNVLFQKLLMPRFHRWAVNDVERLFLVWQRSSVWTMVIGILVAVFTAVIGPLVLPLIFGEKYSTTSSVVALMAICIPFRFLTTSASSIMTTSDLVKVRNYCAIAAILAIVFASFLLIPIWGITGAAFGTIVGEVIWATASFVCVRHYLPKRKMLSVVEAQEDYRDSASENVGTITGPEIRKIIERRAHAPVSVIIPCFNCGTTIVRAVQSLADQTFRPKEVLLVDDCSTDDTKYRLRELADAYEAGWIRVIVLEHNSGPGRARNIGWANATQPYIAFLDSDDAWHPAKLEIQYSWMSSHPDAAISGHPVAQIDDSFPVASQPFPSTGSPKAVSRWKVLFSNKFTPSSVLVRADCTARFDERKRHAEDYFMLIGVILAENRSGYLFSAPLSYVYKAQFGASTGLSAQLWKIQKGEQDNYRFFRKTGVISSGEWLFFSMLSAAKYLRRCFLSGKFN